MTMSANTAPTFLFPRTGQITDLTSLLGGSAAPSYTVTSAALQQDGKIVTVGYSSAGTTYLARTDVYGTSDASFAPTVSTSGYYTVPAAIPMYQVSSVVVQSNTAIVMVGSTAATASDFSLVRVKTDGTLDTSFGGTGSVKVAVGLGNDFAKAAIQQADGKLVAVGQSYNTVTKNDDFSIVRLKANGTLDTSFSDDGKAVFDIASNGNDVATTVVQQSDGKILMAGYSVRSTASVITSYHDLSLVRLNANGTLDTTFDVDGKLKLDVAGSNDYGTRLAVQTDSKILLAGYSYNFNYNADGVAASKSNDFSVVRLNANGSLDTKFSTDGKAVVDVGSHSNDQLTGMVLLSDGKILLSGTSTTGRSTDFALVKLNANGSLDTSFSGDGKALFDVTGGVDTASTVTVQSDGKILIAGTSMIRLNADGTLDTTFGSNVPNVASATDYIEGAAPVVLEMPFSVSDKELIAAGSYGGASLTIGRATAGTTDLELTDGTIDDQFSGAGNLVLDYGTGVATLSGVEIGSLISSYGDGRGVVTLAFNENATQATIDEVLKSIAYQNTSHLPEAAVKLEWFFSDGNEGAQGTGDALATSATTDVNITLVNDAPTGALVISGDPTRWNVMTVTSDQINDADNIDTNGAVDTVDPVTGAVLSPLTYQWYADGVKIAGATGTTLTLTHALTGKMLSVQASYTDQGGTVETVKTASSTSVYYKAAASDAGGVIQGTNQRDWLDGGAGNDTIKGLMGDDTVHGYAGNDSVDGGAGHDFLDGGAGNDTLLGGTGNDTLDGGTGADWLDGGAGNDTYYVDNAFDQVVESAGAGVDMVYSSLSSYTLTANVENGRISIATNATLVGNTLDNTLYAAAGSDTLDGGAGTDTVSYLYVGNAVVGNLGTGVVTHGAATDSLLNIENLTGSSNDDTLTGSTGNNVLDGGAGDDLINGGGGNDTLIGNVGDDTLISGAGNDLLIGGVGQDSMSGGAGNDIFQFASLDDLGTTAGTSDVITDFVHGVDKIDLSQIDANSSIAGDQAFVFVTAGAAPGIGEVSYSSGVLYLHTDTNDIYEIQLTGAPALTAADLVL
jgi:uncharacterized delta-60 repeat protein